MEKFKKLLTSNHPGLGKLYISAGITDSQVDQLIKYSHQDEEIKKFTRDQTRFNDRSAFISWRAKGTKVIYTLVDDHGNLLGLIWFAKVKIKSRKFTQKIEEKLYDITFAIRLYGQARGKGLAKQFYLQSYQHLITSWKYQRFKNKGIWLETLADNNIAVKLYQKLNFTKVSEPDQENRILMVR